MTLVKAIKLLDYYLGEKTKHHEEIDSLERSFSQKDPFEIAQLIGKSLESELVILKMLQVQIVPKCKHHDRMKNGTLYCMNCDMDL